MRRATRRTEVPLNITSKKNSIWTRRRIPKDIVKKCQTAYIQARAAHEAKVRGIWNVKRRTAGLEIIDENAALLAQASVFFLFIWRGGGRENRKNETAYSGLFLTFNY